MGREIATRDFTHTDFAQFQTLVKHQAGLALERVHNDPTWATNPHTLGDETEFVAYYTGSGRPFMDAHELAGSLGSRWTDELGRWNAEHGSVVQPQFGRPYTALRINLQSDVARFNQLLEPYGAQLGACGIFPTLTRYHTHPRQLVSAPRYQVLADQLQGQYGDISLSLDVPNAAPLQYHCAGLGLEAFTTGRQPHISTDVNNVVDWYNASIWAAAVVIGLQGFSPFLFGQHVSNGDARGRVFSAAVRGRGQGLGHGWLRSLDDFITSAVKDPVLLPEISDHPAEKLQELTLHLGSTWPLIRVILEDDGIRLEYRYLPAMPIPDMIAGDAAVHGLMLVLANGLSQDWTQRPGSFEVAQANFVAAQDHGANATIHWPNRQGGYTETTPAEVFLELAGPAVQLLENTGIQDAMEALKPIYDRAALNYNGSLVLLELTRGMKQGHRMRNLARLSGDLLNVPVLNWPQAA